MISRGIFRRNGWLAFLAIATVSIFGLSCSNTKDSLWTRTFHNLSAHYNGYYNAGLKLEEGTDKLAISHEDKYDRILKVFQYANAEKSKAIYPLMDDAMKRTSNVIARHTIIDKNGNEKPNSEKWIDENWLLYGKGLFFKHDYFEAMEAFKYVEVTYKKETTRHLGSLWIAKTYLELTQLKEAEDKLDYLRNQGDFPKKNKWELGTPNYGVTNSTHSGSNAWDVMLNVIYFNSDTGKLVSPFFDFTAASNARLEFWQNRNLTPS